MFWTNFAIRIRTPLKPLYLTKGIWFFFLFFFSIMQVRVYRQHQTLPENPITRWLLRRFHALTQILREMTEKSIVTSEMKMSLAYLYRFFVYLFESFESKY